MSWARSPSGAAAFALFLASCAAFASPARASVITFSEFEHGEVIANSPTTQSIVTSGAVTFGLTVNNRRSSAWDLAVIFDTTETSTLDPDLEDPWSLGNLPASTLFGNVLILQENHDPYDDRNNNQTLDVGDVMRYPDDEARRPAGFFDFYFEQPVAHFGFDFIDIEGAAEHSEAYFAMFYDDQGSTIARLNFADFANFQPDIQWGDRSANQIESRSIAEWTTNAATQTAHIRISLGGSGAIDNLSFEPPDFTTTIPLPTPFVAALLLTPTLARRPRR